jgi:hypothetical protein
MSYRPITDLWLLARPKVKYYGAYPNGFLERARPLLGVTIRDPLLHVCGGSAKLYPNKRRGFGPFDRTVDADATLQPDWVLDVSQNELPTPHGSMWWPSALADPPYTEADALHYKANVEGSTMPNANDLLRKMLRVTRPGGKVGMLHYILPQPPADAHFVAAVGVVVGFNNRIRIFSVFEKTLAMADVLRLDSPPAEEDLALAG